MRISTQFPFVKTIFAMLLAAGLLHAQFEAAEVLGTVTDKTGAVVASASITLASKATGIQAKTSTDGNGNYTFSNVKIGAYTVTAEAPGFSKALASDVTVNVGARQRVDLSLQVGAVAETVEVTGAAAILQTDSSDRGQVSNAKSE